MLLFDMGLPMIFPTMYLMIAALLPIVFLEGYFISRKLVIDLRSAMLWTGLANLISTLIGIPLTWCGLFLFQSVSGGTSTFHVGPFLNKLLSVTVQAPWLLPFEQEESWLLFAAELFLLIPFFFASWLIEYGVMRNALTALVSSARHQPDDSFSARSDFKVEVRRSVRNANLLSYGLLALFLIGLLANNLVTSPR